MNVLFLTLYHIDSLQNHGIYEDLLREFIKQGHHVYVVSPIERRFQKETTLHTEGTAHILELKTGNIQKTNILEKGISTVLIERQFIAAIKRYFPDTAFDLIVYSTPPITLAGVVRYIKQRDHAETYLLLKDIFPQNAVDIGLMSTTGIKRLLYRYFRNKETRLYAVSDHIGCMSPANAAYLLEHNPQIDPAAVEVCPNCIEPFDMSLSDDEKTAMREKYGLPTDKTVFVYGGNLGKPQGIPFLIDCLKAHAAHDDAFFFLVGDGTEYAKLQAFIDREHPANVKLMNRLPKADYDRMIAACDVGLIFLDHRFTIPNFPSRLLTYMQAGLPVFAVTDPHSDIGNVITEGEFGWWCESNNAAAVSEQLCRIVHADRTVYGQNARQYLNRFYHVRDVYANCFLPLQERMNHEQ